MNESKETPEDIIRELDSSTPTDDVPKDIGIYESDEPFRVAMAHATKMSKKRRLGFVFIAMALFSVSYQVGSMMEVSEADARALMEQFEAIAQDIDGVGIFVHNLMINVLMFIPGFGFAWGILTSFQTGMAFSAFSSIEPMLKDFPALAILYLSPFGLMELFAYSIAMSRSYLMIKRIWKRQSLKTDLKAIVTEISIVVGLLLAGGLLEAYMIDWAMESGFSMVEMLK